MNSYGIDEYNYEIAITSLLCDSHIENYDSGYNYSYLNEYCIYDILDFIPSYSYKLNNFTYLIEKNCLNGSPIQFAEILWNDCNDLIHHPDKEKTLENWKYGSEFKSTESWHQNGEQHYKDFTLEASFTTTLLMMIYH